MLRQQRNCNELCKVMILRNKYKLQFIAQNLYTFSEPLIYLSCFIFIFQLIEYQSFQKVKHTTLMFHF